jgi:adenylate cyclase class 2
MIEVEIKVPIDDKSIIKEGLKKIGFSFKKTIQQKDHYFQHPLRNFAKTDEALRVRKTFDGSLLNYKGPKLDKMTKTREEIELKIQDADKLIQILDKIGFREVFLVEKSREIYKSGKITASVDSVKDLGDYLELEILSKEKEDIEKSRNELFSILEKIHLSKDKMIRKSYLELLLKI